MNRPIFTPAAEADIQHAFEFYEAKSAGLGADFLERVEQTATRTASNPHQYQTVAGDVRRAPVRGRPYGPWYRIEGDSVVIACLHYRTSPSHAVRRAMRKVEPT